MDKSLKIWFHPRRTARLIERLEAENQAAQEQRIENARLEGELRATRENLEMCISEISRRQAEAKEREAKLLGKLAEMEDNSRELKEIEQAVEKMIEVKKQYREKLHGLKQELSEAKLKISRMEGERKSAPAFFDFDTEQGKLDGAIPRERKTQSKEDPDSGDWLQPLPQK